MSNKPNVSNKPSVSNKPNVLFLCTGNSCRSQMAEGFAKHFHGGILNAYSAGLEAHGLNRYAVQAMQQDGVDISDHQSQRVDELAEARFDYIVTVCDHADQHCPHFPGGSKIIHHSFDDPPKLAESANTEDEIIACYQRVREQIKQFIQELPERFMQVS